jgi:hypothetical protein
VSVIPVGEPATGKTLTNSIDPRERRSSATPSKDFGLADVSETKSQHPSGLATVLNGWPGRGTYETGDAGVSLQRVGAPVAARVWPSATEAKSIVSAHAAVNVKAVFVLRMRRIIFANTLRRNAKISSVCASRSKLRSKNAKLN